MNTTYSKVFRFLQDRNENILSRTYIGAVADGTGLSDGEIRDAVSWLRASGFINPRFRLWDRKGRKETLKRKPKPKTTELFQKKDLDNTL